MIEMDTPPLPSFRLPPLDEVAAGIQFAPLPFRLIDVAAFHSKIATDYPVALDQPPVSPSFETFGAFGAAPGFPGMLFPIPGPPWREWFVSEDDEHVVQLQLDRLIVNWRMRPSQGRPYPRFERVRQRFEDTARKLQEFVTEREFPPVQVNQCDLTYFNKVPLSDSETFADMGRLIVGFEVVDHSEPLRSFTEAAVTVGRVIRSPAGEPFARLQVECAPALEPSGQRAWKLNIMVRGRPLGAGLPGALDFFDISHREIVNTFAALTTGTMHNAWERIT